MKTIFIQNKDSDREAYLLFRDADVLGLDTETSGLSFVSDNLWSVQISDGTTTAVYDHTAMEYFPFLNQLLSSTNRVKVAHNASFDLKFLWKRQYRVENIYCSLVAEQVLCAGKKNEYTLESTIQRVLGIKLNKEARKDFYQVYTKKPSDKHPTGIINENYFGLTKKWTQELIDYAAADVIYLRQLYDAQIKQASVDGLIRTMKLEQILVPEIASMEYRGIQLDMKALDQFEADMLQKAEECRQEVLNHLEPLFKEWYLGEYEKSTIAHGAWKLEHEAIMKSHNRRVDRKLHPDDKAMRDAHKLEEPKRLPEYEGLNLNSVPQRLQAFKLVGLTDIESTDKQVLEDRRSLHPAIDVFLDYSKYNKLAEFAKIRDAVEADGYVHGQFNQTGTESGRMSASKPNLQNQPARSAEGKRLRACFTAGEGNKFVIADYAAIELVILGVLAKDDRILEAINSGHDLHIWTMQYFLGVPYDKLESVRQTGEPDEEVELAINGFKKMMPLKEIESLTGQQYVKKFRDYIKTLVYGTAYGLSPFGLANKFKCETELARDLIDRFFKAYPKIKKFLEAEGVTAFYKGYSVNINGRRRYYDVFNKPMRNAYKDDSSFLLATREWHIRKSRVQRQASNNSIQSASADITKLAMAIIAKKSKVEFKSPQEFLKYGIVLAIHDEVVLRVPEAKADIAASILKESMESAAYQILGNSAKIEVEASIADYWKK